MKRQLSFALVLSLFFFASFAQASTPLYVVDGPRGSKTITSRKPASGTNYTIYSPSRGSYARYSVSNYSRARWAPRPVKSDYDGMIKKTAVKKALDPELVKAVVHVESAFRPTARSHKGAMGLMQLMPGTAKRMGVSNAYHPEQNVDGGTKYLKYLLNRYDGNEKLALAAYNAGEGAVDNYGRNIPPYRETQDYVRKVLQMREKYRCVNEGRKNC